MSVTASISKPLEQGYVQVDTAYKSGYKRHYKVPRRNAKTFATEFVKQDKNLNLYSNIIFFTSIFTGVLGATFFTRKMDSRFKQFLTQTATAIGLTSLTSIGMNKYAQSAEKNLVKGYGAKEIFYRA